MVRLLIALTLLVPPGAPSAEDVITLPTRSSVTQSYLLAAPETGKAQAVAILFPGSGGKVDLERETVGAIAKWLLKQPYPREIK